MKLGEFAGALGAIIAQLVERKAAGLELGFHLRQLVAQRLRLRGDGLGEDQRLGARGSEFLLPCFQLCTLGDALLALRRRRSPLLLDGQHAPLQVRMEPVNALEGSFSAPAPLFKAGELRRDLRRLLLRELSLLTQQGKLGLRLIETGLRLRVFRFQARCFFPLLGNRLALGLAGILVARRLNRPLLQAALDPLRLALHLLQGRAQVGRIRLCQAALFGGGFKLRGQLVDGARQDGRFRLRLGQACVKNRPACSRPRATHASAPADPALAGLPPVTVAL